MLRVTDPIRREFSPLARAILVNLIAGLPYSSGLACSRHHGRHGVRATLLTLQSLSLVAPTDHGWSITEEGVRAIRAEMSQ